MEDGYKGFEYVIYAVILVVFYIVLKSPKKSDGESGEENSSKDKKGE